MTFSFDLGGAHDFPHGQAQHGGWYCRACGNPINTGDSIYKPQSVWVCEPCFQSGQHTANTRSNRQYQYSPPPGSSRTSSPPPGSGEKPPPQQQSTGSDIQMVDEDNWIEIVFDVIPDKHLKRVYASLSKTYHPDIGGDEDTQRRINDAYAARGLK